MKKAPVEAGALDAILQGDRGGCLLILAAFEFLLLIEAQATEARVIELQLS